MEPYERRLDLCRRLAGLTKTAPQEEDITKHHLWWMTRLPHADGSTGGFYNNWWEYVVNYDDALKRLPPPGASFQKARTAMYAND